MLLLQELPEPVVSLDVRGQIVNCNDVTAKKFGYSRANCEDRILRSSFQSSIALTMMSTLTARSRQSKRKSSLGSAFHRMASRPLGAGRRRENET